MTDKEAVIPVLDCNDVGINEGYVGKDAIKSFGEQFKNALASSGFCYLKNHGVDMKLIEGYMKVSNEFFAKSVEIKQKHVNNEEKDFGWDALEREKVNPERPGDLKETFNYCPTSDDGNWPDIEDFQKYSKLVYDECSSLARRLCDCLSVGLGLDSGFMANAHGLMGKKGNSSTLRTLYYPPLPKNFVIKPNQIRLGEHSDYGTITLLFQDNIGGLEANIPGKGFIPVTPIPDTVVVNIGDLMQRWTSDKLIATKHRVLIPEEEITKRKSRQSVVFFVRPDDEYIIKPLDGSNKYKPISNGEYYREKVNATF